MNRICRRAAVALLTAATTLASISPAAVSPLLSTTYAATAARSLSSKEKTARKKLLSFKKKYKEGKKWGNNVYRSWQCGIYSGGYGCAAFAFELFNKTFGNVKAKQRKSNFTNAKVGDILRMNGNTHCVIVIGAKPNGGVEVAEANYGGRVHWGRTVSKKALKKANWLITAY